jgi:hypothetical protein
MATHYVLYIHGVATRNKNYADKFHNALTGDKRLEGLTIQPVVAYWGDENGKREQAQLKLVTKAPIWPYFLLTSFIRKDFLWPFVGDAASYVSHTAGADIINKVCSDAVDKLNGADLKQDVLHLVSHSWGTVILFDILFAEHWDALPDRDLPVANLIRQLRHLVKGLGVDSADRDCGIRLASINTMGSPVALFTLMDTVSTHGFKADMNEMLSRHRFTWRNMCNPLDLVAYPLSKLMPDYLADPDLQIKDVLIEPFHWRLVLGMLVFMMAAYLAFSMYHLCFGWKIALSVFIGVSVPVVGCVLIFWNIARSHLMYWDCKKVREQLIEQVLSNGKPANQGSKS